MKFLAACLLCLFATVKSEPDSDVEIQQVEVIEVPWQESPEPAYGPPKQEYGPPKQEYGPPKPVYGPPKPVYGPPPELTTTTEADLSTTTEYPTTTEVPASTNGTNTTSNGTNNTRSGKLKEEDNTQRGAYYIYHPSGVLQRVVYATKDDTKNMAYTAQLKYQNVEPINGPIYTYDPQTYVFQRINRR